MSSKFYTGDSLEILRTLPGCSVQCVVTSPPYWGLRDYGVAGQLGLEPTPDEYIAKITEVFREVRRVLRDDGTCWVNMGDSYGVIGGNTHAGFNGRWSGTGGPDSKQDHAHDGIKDLKVKTGLRSKNLVGMPWRLAFSLQADGWYLRSDCIWHKPNPMPESVRDRPTKAHEYVFLLTKSSRYFWDSEGGKEKAKYGRSIKPNMAARSNRHAISSGVWRHCGDIKEDVERENNESQRSWDLSAGRNLRTVWTIPSKPFKESHFATFPPALVDRCVNAGTSEWGCCPICGKAWVMEIERTTSIINRSERTHSMGRTRSSGTMIELPRSKTLGFHSACTCPEIDPIPCTVLDPFSGAGTVALVCDRLGRDSIGIELNPKYVAMAERRLEQNRRRKINGHGKEIEDLPDQARFAWVEG